MRQILKPEFEIVMDDGSTQKVSPGDIIQTKSGKKYTLNNSGGRVLLYDPAFKLSKVQKDRETGKRFWLVDGARRYLTETEEDEQIWIAAASAFILTVLIGSIVLLAIAAVA